MPHRLTLQERVFCVKHYYSENNVNAVIRRYEDEFGKPIKWDTIKNLVKRFEDTGTVEDKKREGRPSSVTSENNKLVISETLRQQSQNSTRNLAREFNLSQSSVVRIIRKLGLKAWRPRLLQELTEDDHDRRLQFCEDEFDRSFNYRDVIWTDEAKFMVCGQVNRHNCIFYSMDNPHEVFEKAVNSPGVMVWGGICRTALIGPYFFTTTVTGESYLQMLDTYAFPRINELVTGAGDQRFWWQQDGAPPHYARIARARLDTEFPGRWIGRRGTVEWPPRSPDLSPMDYAVWGIIKEKVYKQDIQNVEHLKRLITEAFQSFDANLCSKICDSLPERISACIAQNGGHFENFRK